VRPALGGPDGAWDHGWISSGPRARPCGAALAVTSSIRVLLIEDAEDDAILIAAALRQQGRSVEYERVQDANSMRIALEKGGWDLIIADWFLPTFGALAALEIVKERRLDVPFIILSGVVGEDTAVKAMRAGATDFLVKDDLSRLSAAVERELLASKEREARREGEKADRAREIGLRAAVEEHESPSLAGQLRRTFVMIGAMVSVAFVATALAFLVSRVWVTPEFDECRETATVASNLYMAMLDEETGLRGYLLTRDRRFLEPYARGALAAVRADEALDAHAASIPAFARGLARARAAAERWSERWAKPAAETTADGAAPSAEEGLALFDAYRAAQTAFSSTVAARTELLAGRAEGLVTARVSFDLALFALLLVLAWRQHRALHEGIVAPVAALLRDMGRVRDGELTSARQSGPSELRRLGAGLNDIVRALAVARGIAESRAELLREHSNRLRQILDASREFSESLNLGYVVRSVISSTKAVGGYDLAVVWLMEDDQKGLREASLAESDLTPAAPRDDTLAWRAAKSGRLAFTDLEGRVQFGDGGSARVHARAIPLVVGARVVGALQACHTEPRAASVEGIELLQMLAAHAATAIESARLNEVAEERSHMDPLTQLHNRRRLEEDLDAECKRCGRYGRPLALVMLDVDHFKAVNDTLGHPQGDVALQEVAQVIGGAVRTTDSAYRYGGEEFCVLLRETGAESAMHFAERLRQRIEARFAAGTTPGLTASFGVAEVSADTLTPRALVKAADAAMYASKRSGRNRVVLSVPPPAAVPPEASDPHGFDDPPPRMESCIVPASPTAFVAQEAQTAGRRRL
jgi:diguanylate cyclase (GGDEF)-like protein